MSDNLNFKLVVNAINKFSEPAKKMQESSLDFTHALSLQAKQLSDIGAQKKAIVKQNAYRTSLKKSIKERINATEREKQLKTEVEIHTTQVKKAKGQLAKLQKQKEKGEKVDKQTLATLKKQAHLNKTLINAHKNAEKQLKSKTQAEKRARSIASSHSAKLREQGINTRKLASEQKRLGEAYAKAEKKAKSLSHENAKVVQAQKNFDKNLQRAAHASLVADGMRNVGQTALGLVSDPIHSMRQIESKKGALYSVGMQNLQPTINMSIDLSDQFAGLQAPNIIASAYDIKSGISNLSDYGVADMTAKSAITAKATRAQVEQMTSLFATGYGTFKDALYSEISDEEFGSIFSATLAKSVQQFKTTGAEMQQAMESMGSGLAQSKVSLADQVTALGMLQQKAGAGESGTMLGTVEESAAQAQERFEKMGLDIQVLNHDGNMRSIPDLLDAMQRNLGREYSTEKGAIISEAFGSDVAGAFFKNLWGQHELFRKNAQEISKAQKQGFEFTVKMAKLMDNNMDAELNVANQRWFNIKATIGKALIPTLNFFLPILEKGALFFKNLADNGGIFTQVAIGAVAVFGIAALTLAPLITAFASLAITMAWLRKNTLQTNAALAMQGLAGGGIDGDGKGKKGRRKKGILGKGLKMLGSKAGLIGAGIGALSIGSSLMDSDLSAGEKAQATTKGIGGIGGALGGAVLGSMILPGIGTAIGAIVGGIGGEWIGNKLGSLFKSESKDFDKNVQQSLNPITTAKENLQTHHAPVSTNEIPRTQQSYVDKSHVEIHVHPSQGMSETQLAEKVKVVLNEEKAKQRRQKHFNENNSNFYDMELSAL